MRQFKKEGERDDVFAGTPETSFMRYLVSNAASHRRSHAILIVDISVAFMHARMDEEVVVKPPSDIKTSKYWKLRAAVNGTRRASHLWQEFAVGELRGFGFRRNDVNPCVVKHDNKDIQGEMHGDDFLFEGPRKALLDLKTLMETKFKVKIAELISEHKDDKKEGFFLKRKISVDQNGWHLELDARYANDFLRKMGLTEAKPVNTPGVKDTGKEGELLSPQEHREYRGGAGLLQCMAEHRVDAAFATKELMRSAHSPSEKSWQQLKRVGRYLAGAKRCVIDFEWQEPTAMVTIYVDSDWAGDTKERRSTSGGVLMLGKHLIKHWTSTQATISLSSAEAESKAVTKGCIEGLGFKHTLGCQGYEVILTILTDASGALGMLKRLGTGKRCRHLEVPHLWLQQLIRNGIVDLRKILTTKYLADILSKHVGGYWLSEACRLMGVRCFNTEEEAELEDDDYATAEREDTPEERAWAENFVQMAATLSMTAREGLRAEMELDM